MTYEEKEKFRRRRRHREEEKFKRHQKRDQNTKEYKKLKAILEEPDRDVP